MTVGACYLKHGFDNNQAFVDKLNEIHQEKAVKKSTRQTQIELGYLFMNIAGHYLKHIDISHKMLEKTSKGHFSGKIPYVDITSDLFIRLSRSEEDDNNWMFTPKPGHNQTILSLTSYPQIKKLIMPFLSEEQDRIKEVDCYFGKCVGVKYGGFSKAIPIGKYQIIEQHHFGESGENGYNVVNIAHPMVENIEIYGNLGDCVYEFFYRRHSSSNNINDLTKLAFLIYYYFINSVYYLKGTAGGGKVVLNMLLYMIGKQQVCETKAFSRQADWVAFVAKDSRDFLKKIESGKVFAYCNELDKKAKDRTKIIEDAPDVEDDEEEL
jgi:hypothetical protein